MRNRKKCKYRYIEKGRYMKKSDLFHKPEMNRKYMAAAGIVLLLLMWLTERTFNILFGRHPGRGDVSGRKEASRGPHL